MNKSNQVVFLVGFICVVVWFAFYVNRLNLNASDRELNVLEDESVTIKLVSKGMTVDNLEVEIIKTPDHGILVKNKNYSQYQPNKDYFGSDIFEYRFRVGDRVGDSAAVKISVSPVNDTPVAVGQNLEVDEDSELEILLKGRDADKDLLTYAIVKEPKYGRIKGMVPRIRYIPGKNYDGKDSFTFKVDDGTGAFGIGNVEIVVKAVNDTPIAKNANFKTNVETPVLFDLSGTDIENSTLRYNIVQNPKHGKIETNNSEYLYVPDSKFEGNDEISFQVYDGQESSLPAFIKFEVKGVNHQIELGKRLNGLLENGGIAIGNYDHPEYIQHSGKYVPASLLKMVTAAAAMHILGESYRFKTEIYVDLKRNLYLKGYGDPSLTSQDWHSIGRELNSKGVFKEDIEKIIVDPSSFSYDLKIDGRRNTIHYFDAPPSALPSNQNTIEVRISGDKRILIKDNHTPLTPLIIKKARRLPAGYQHFNVALDPEESLKYSAELAGEIFSKYGAHIETQMELGKTPEDLSPVYVHTSETVLEEMVKQMLKESNNFIANQLLLCIAYEKYGSGVGIKNGVEIVTDFLEKHLQISSDKFRLVEGSGLSTKNRVDLLSMLKIINYFHDKKDLLPSLSLSKYRDLARSGRKWKILAKSGTLSNISTLAGFIFVDNKEWKPFVIMFNNSSKQRGIVMDIIGRYYNG
jgi:serine-type D-Ala-D-Ala carboxypeptidase/endopeptidase (penicillin-binding protein 4)